MSGSKSQVNIIAVVDVIGALSIKSLLEGNLCMVDDGAFDSAHQGTPNLITVVKPGQVVSWTALAVDLQTPVEIKKIEFLPANRQNGAAGSGAHFPGASGQGQSQSQAAPGQTQGAAIQGQAVPTQGQGQGASPFQGQGASPFQGQGAAAQGAHAQGARGQEQDTDSAKLDLDVWTGVVPHWMARGVPYQYRLEVQMYDGSNSILHIDSPALMCQ
ncbi:hypothetical protein AB0B50_21510 [Streptomyces sp. NPDC041068]|uniref:hypothetical protein n=1 Tax=Streptomyces sp. NPDC041068 TaxID=3155130 RepID=UPI0033D641BF